MLKVPVKNYGIYSDLIRSTFYIEKTLRKLLSKPQNPVAADVVSEIDCSNCQAVYFGESK